MPPLARSPDAAGLDQLETEARAPGGGDLDLLSTRELVERINREDAAAVAAVADAADAVARAIDAIAARIAEGGRLVYAGAGSSGRLAALDAAECVSTFGTEEGRVVALVAGGPEASPPEQAAAEDDDGAGGADLLALEPGPLDAVVGVSASGRTPYAVGALRAARAAGALTVAISSVEGSELGGIAEHEIVTPTGPELLAGSTRLKAGTAQKLVLNAISTISMIRLGKTFGDLMVDVQATNEKLRARVARIVRYASGASEKAAEQALAEAGGDAKVAIVSLLARTSIDDARARLEGAGGKVRAALAVQ